MSSKQYIYQTGTFSSEDAQLTNIAALIGSFGSYLPLKPAKGLILDSGLSDPPRCTCLSVRPTNMCICELFWTFPCHRNPCLGTLCTTATWLELRFQRGLETLPPRFGGALCLFASEAKAFLEGLPKNQLWLVFCLRGPTKGGGSFLVSFKTK